MVTVEGRWFLVIPPEGAARQVGENLWAAMDSLLPKNRRKRFDTAANLRVFDGLLKEPSDDMAVDLMGQTLAVQALDFAATHVLVVALAPVTFFTVNLLKRRGVKTIHWFVEDYRQAKYWDKVLPAYTHWFAIQRAPMEAACAAAGTQFATLATAAGSIPEGRIKPWDKRLYDAAFVGLPSPYRVRVLEALKAAGLSLALAGPGWEKYSGPLQSGLIRKGWMNAAETLDLLGDARLGLHAPYEDPAIDREACHVSPRFYEALASGCALLCEDAPLCREALSSFVAGFFTGPGEAVGAARKLLAKPLAAAEQGFQRGAILTRHSYRERFAAIATACG